MGNCMEICMLRQEGVEMKQEQEKEQKAGGFVKEEGFGKGGFRVKVVLTKEELVWLMLQLNNKGEKTLEDVLWEIEKGRGRVDDDVKGWKPSLESIMETPEVHEMAR